MELVVPSYCPPTRKCPKANLWLPGSSSNTFHWHSWPCACALTLFLEGSPGRSGSQPKAFLLAPWAAGCESFLLAPRAGQDELAARLSGAQAVLVPECPTVTASWKDNSKAKFPLICSSFVTYIARLPSNELKAVFVGLFPPPQHFISQ